MSARRSIPRTAGTTNRRSEVTPKEHFIPINYNDYTRSYQGETTTAAVNKGHYTERLFEERKRQMEQKTPSPRSMYVPPPIFDSDNEYEDYKYTSHKTSPITTNSNKVASRRSIAATQSPPSYKKYLTSSERLRAKTVGTDWAKVTLQYLQKYSHQSFRYLKELLVSYGLIFIFITLVLAITFVYMNKSAKGLTNISKDSIEKINIKYTPCDEISDISTLVEPSYNCIERQKLDNAITIAKELLHLLQLKAERHNCHDPSQADTVYILEFIKYLHRKGNPVDMFQLQALEYLLQQNPQWTIEILGTKGAPATISNSMGKPTLNEELYFALLKPNLPFKCQLRKKMRRFFLIVGMAALIGVTTLISYVVIQFVRSRRNERYAAIDDFIEQIIEELSSQADEEFIINHLRDKLIPISERRGKLLWSWKEALRVLELSDSRIQFGMYLRNGEECRTMKWIGNTLNEALNASKSKSPPKTKFID